MRIETRSGYTILADDADYPLTVIRLLLPRRPPAEPTPTWPLPPNISQDDYGRWSLGWHDEPGGFPTRKFKIRSGLLDQHDAPSPFPSRRFASDVTRRRPTIR